MCIMSEAGHNGKHIYNGNEDLLNARTHYHLDAPNTSRFIYGEDVQTHALTCVE